VPGLINAGGEFRDDDGSAEPLLEATLSAYAAGRAGEHAVLTALSHARLLVPVVAAVTGVTGAPGPEDAPRREKTRRREKTGGTYTALPVLNGRDGRRAILAFTSLVALARWREDARPLPAAADRVWQAAAEERVPAVVVDVAGPVPLVVEGARLAALAAGRPVPPPHEDPDVRAAVAAAAAADPAIAAVSVAAGSGDSDITVRLVLCGGAGAAAEGAADGGVSGGAADAARRTATAVMSALAGRFRRGIEIAVEPAAAARAKHSG
jgi:SseB protein N-terminal domain